MARKDLLNEIERSLCSLVIGENTQATFCDVVTEAQKGAGFRFYKQNCTFYSAEDFARSFVRAAAQQLKFAELHNQRIRKSLFLW